MLDIKHGTLCDSVIDTRGYMAEGRTAAINFFGDNQGGVITRNYVHGMSNA